MKQSLILVILLTILCTSTPSFALYATRGGFHYIGIGGSYAFENFDYDDIEDWFEPIDVDVKDTWGIKLKFGYRFTDNFSFEGDFDYLANFETDESMMFDSIPVVFTFDAKGELDIWTLMFAGKFSYISGNVSPFFVVGFGFMHADLDAELAGSVTIAGIPASFGKISDSDSDMRMCSKIGGGFDFFPTKRNISIGIEWSYVFGLSDFTYDLDEFDSEDAEIKIRYSTITLGVAYYF